MKNTSLLVFSVINNIFKRLKKQKNITVDIFKPTNIRHYERTSDFCKDNSKRIYNELENNYYTYRDIIVYILYNYGLNKKINWYDIKESNIIKTIKIFTKKQLQKDKDFILQINKELKFKSLLELFEIRENGTPIIYELIMKDFISPVIYVKFYEKVLTNLKKDVILKSKEYEQFEWAMNQIIKTIKGGFNE
jgi:hypothetical protein